MYKAIFIFVTSLGVYCFQMVYYYQRKTTLASWTEEHMQRAMAEVARGCALRSVPRRHGTMA